MTGDVAFAFGRRLHPIFLQTRNETVRGRPRDMGSTDGAAQLFKRETGNHRADFGVGGSAHDRRQRMTGASA